MEINSENFRSGFVGMAGVPNAGKSTLTNRLVGQKVSITSGAPQTTRHRVCGILTTPAFQAIFVDLPGILVTDEFFNQKLVQTSEAALRDCDFVLHLRDPESAGSDNEQRVIEILKRGAVPIFEVWNKIDLNQPVPEEPEPPLPYRASVSISALTGQGIGDLLRIIEENLPPGPQLYPAEDLSDRNLQFLCAEIVREKVFEFLRQEVPYGIATLTDEWKDRPDGRTYLRVVIQTDREAHKSMIIGQRGTMLKRIGSAARPEIEALIGGPVFLELWVAVKSKWRKDERELKRLGLSLS